MKEKQLRTFFISNTIVGGLKKHSVIQLKLLYSLIDTHKIQTQLANQDYEIVVSRNELKGMLGSYCTKTKRLEDIINDLDNKLYIVEGTNITGFMSMFDYCKFDREYGNICFKFSDDMIELIEDIQSNWCKIDLNHLSKLKGKYSPRMYELSRQYHNQKFLNVPVEHFRNLFNVPNSYLMSHLTERVLESSINEVNEACGTNIKYSKSKSKNDREITHIKLEF